MSDGNQRIEVAAGQRLSTGKVHVKHSEFCRLFQDLSPHSGREFL